MSLQNRWTSFDDPDRWIVRFGEDLELYPAPPHHVDRGQGKGPSYIYWKDNTGTITNGSNRRDTKRSNKP